ncbi:DUF3455 domain-containing protein [Actinomycetospora sp. C-140]
MTGSVRALILALVVAALTACSTSTRPAPAPPGGAPAPAQLAVPVGQRLALTATVRRGVQVYACRAGAWALKQPAAVLTAESTDVLHDAGPRWTATADGSSVIGTQAASVPVPGAASDLLLRATGHDGQGVMAAVDFVQRLGVQGGAAPSGACADGAEQPVAYTAEYRFYAPEL